MSSYQLRAMSVGDILDTAVAVYRRHFGTLMSVIVVCLGIPTILAMYVTLAGGTLLHPWLYLVAALLQGVGGIVAGGAIVRVVSAGYLGEESDAREALATAMDRFGQLFVAGLAKYLVIGLAFLLLVVPGIVVACGYAVVIQAVMLESLASGTEALGRSWSLTRQFRGKALVLGVVVFCLVYVPFFAAGMLTGLVPSLRYAFVILGQLLQFIAMPAFACVFTLFYYDLRVRKEAFDLEQLSLQVRGGSAAPA
jgi:hypothetical protein